ncbi:MAG: hypothetical protein P1P84_08895, partial [Deferrisomatales bacterium]|nr:hypothetical protein [Deferrisomatales bacterium]
MLVLLAAAPAGAEGPFGGSVRSLLLDGKAVAPVWAATSRGLFHFQGARWQRVAGLGQTDLVAVAQAADRLLVADANGSVAASEDGGATWQPSVTGLRGRYGHPPRGLFTLAVERGDPTRVFAGSAGQGVFESRNAGRTWRLLFEGLEEEPPPALHAVAVLPTRGQRPLLSGTQGRGLFAWTDAGWKGVGEGLPPGLRVQCLAEDPARPLHLALGTRGEGLWESEDGGASWRLLRKGLFGVV